MVIFNSYVKLPEGMVNGHVDVSLHLRTDSRYLERCIEAFRSTLRQFAMKDLRDYAERGCEVICGKGILCVVEDSELESGDNRNGYI